MSLARALSDRKKHAAVAADAVAEAEAAVYERRGFTAVPAQVGLDMINRLRPGFLERHVHAMLPALAGAIDPHWAMGLSLGDGKGHLQENAAEIAERLLDVADQYVARATDRRAVAIYNQLRPRAPRRVQEQMPRIAQFIERHSDSA